MTLENFKTKHKDLIELGAIRFTDEHPAMGFVMNKLRAGENVSPDHIEIGKNLANKMFNNGCKMIIIDRFSPDLKTIYCDAKELVTARRDVLKMGFVKGYGVGVYVLPE